MSTFKELKDKLQGVTPKKESPTKKSSDKNPVKKETINKEFELEEARYLITLIAKSDFSGKDVQMVYNIALKLQNIISDYIEKENKNG
jgi:hypothetical protein